MPNQQATNDQETNDQATTALTHGAPEVLKHLDMVQGNIARMSDNSKSCKQWCVALVAAIFAVVAKQGSADFAVLALFPLLLFGFLDNYYLTLERAFIDANNQFLTKLNDGSLSHQALFCFSTERDNVRPGMLKTFTSLAIWPFYCLLAVMILMAWLLAS